MRSYPPPRGHRWAELEETKAELPAEEQEADAVLARAFSTPDGARALELMHLMTTWKRNAVCDSDGALREAEAQRRLVAILEARIARHNGRKIASGKQDGGRDDGRRRK